VTAGADAVSAQFVYFTAATHETVIKEETNNNKPHYRNLFVIPREGLQKLGILGTG
jgi:hypothetical protein